MFVRIVSDDVDKTIDCDWFQVSKQNDDCTEITLYFYANKVDSISFYLYHDKLSKIYVMNDKGKTIDFFEVGGE